MRRWHLFGRQRRLERQLAAATAEVRAAAQESRAAAQAAEASATSVREALGRALAPDPQDVSRRRYLLLIFICAGFLLGTFVALYFVPPAFTDPAPAFKNLGSIETHIATTDEETNNNPRLFEWDNRIFIHARYSQNSAVVYYTLWFPSKFAGRKFALLLGGSAVMRNAHAGIQVGPP
jgi:hypothetical protein